MVNVALCVNIGGGVTDRTYQDFTQAVKELLEGKAKTKKYNETGIDGPNQLFEFVSSLGEGPPLHALGEIVYKVKRYAALKNEEDVLKIAAWAFLVWRHQHANK